MQARIPVTVGARVTATVSRLLVDQGNTVRQGELLATLENRDAEAKAAAAGEAVAASRNAVAAAEAALAKASSDLALARSNYQRNRGLVEQKFISPAAMDTVTAALRAAESTEKGAAASLAASRANERDAEVGDTVVPGSPIFQMVDPRTLWVATRIDETVAGRVAPGQSAVIRLRSGGEAAGKVARIAHQSDSATREIEVDVAFDTPPARFAIGQEAEVAITVGTARGPVVPATSLIEWQGKRGVLELRDGHARFLPVKTRPANGVEVLVEKGLTVGSVVLARPNGVRPGARVRPERGG
ncbi:MAG: efflux RND transporter periplasmic adaptor subunit [Betaproteobacteria bacterium]|nr:efflux RND transporter periplasmic adaptor subunit [Betaproteobacteria bacterium]